MKNEKSGIKVSGEVIMSIRTNCDFDTRCFTSPESIQSMNKRIEDNNERCENLIEQGKQNITHMLVGNLEQQEPVKRKQLSI